MYHNDKCVDIYRVKKADHRDSNIQFDIGDIVIVDESGESSTGTNLTKKIGFSPFFQYEYCDKLTSIKLSWAKYLSIIHFEQELERELYLTEEEIKQQDNFALKKATLSGLRATLSALNIASGNLEDLMTLHAGSDCDEANINGFNDKKQQIDKLAETITRQIKEAEECW